VDLASFEVIRRLWIQGRAPEGAVVANAAAGAAGMPAFYQTKDGMHQADFTHNARNEIEALARVQSVAVQ
jgi:hypothetical protein